MTAFRVTDVSIFRPYPDEVPWELLADGGVDDAALADVMRQNYLRVAKLQDRVVGTYGIRPETATRFELVTLIVTAGFRRQGLGRWLLGHAIGLAETKGGREVVVRAPRIDHPGGRFLDRMGFRGTDGDRRLELVPE